MRQDGPVDEVDIVLGRLDEDTAERVREALGWLLGAEGERLPLASVGQLDLQNLLWHRLPVSLLADGAEHHEIAWALGDFFEAAGLPRYAGICRDRRTHEILAAWHRDEEEGHRLAHQAQLDSGVLPPDTATFEFGEWMGPQEAAAHHGASAFLEDGIVSGALDPGKRGFGAAAQRRVDRYLSLPSDDLGGTSPLTAVRRERIASWRSSFRGVPEAFWARAMPAVESAPDVPARVELSLAPAMALLEAVGEGVTLTGAGYLPTSLALALDERFAWSQDYALGRPRGEADVHQLRFLHEHLRAQRLLTRRGRRLTVSASGRTAMADAGLLWAAVVSPAPRWGAGFEQDALAVLALSLLGGGHLTDDVRDEMSHVLSRKWRPKDGGPIDDDVWWIETGWYRVGMALGWWQDRRRSLELRLSDFGRVAAACVFRAVATGPTRR